MEFPRLVYQRTKGKEFRHALVKDIDEHDEKLADGWHDTVPEALGAGASTVAKVDAGKPAAVGAGGNTPGAGAGNPDDAPPTRAELETKAKELDIKGNISGMKDATLLSKINAALSAKE